MAHHAKNYCYDFNLVGDYAWLFTEHLPLVSDLSWKLANHFIGLYQVIKQINPVNFKLEILFF